MKRIVLNTDSLIMGGAEKIALEYANLLKDNYEVFLLINEDNGIDNILEELIDKNIRYQFVVDKEIMEKLNKYRILKKKNFIYKIYYSYYLKKRRKSYQKNIEKILKEKDYDYLIDFYCKIPWKLVNEKTICWLHMTLGNLKEKTKKEYQKKFTKCKNVIVLNEEMKKEVLNIFEIDPNKVMKIYNFFNIKKLENLSLNQEELTLNQKKLIKDNYIFACCRVDKQKDLDTLIDAFKDLKDEFKIKEKLYIAGDGDQRKRLEKKVTDLNLKEDIIFLGTQKNPYVWMKNAKLFVHSSHREGFGMVLVEALITNGIVISTDCPVGPKEILENGKSGVLVLPKNKKDLANKIYQLLRDQNLRINLLEESKRRKNDFSKEIVLNKIKTIFEG
ncbi:glycosyltransferase [Cetobacterium somerae]|uniref:glycosyltransferase n=1 Tax=Cetobacterium somerae TaxID=188913 RepID=UPI001F0571F5|nr:glycosyltransferase [Cetobacterium somerae]UPO97389.1 glycosyltransferase [Cetobacterium somerae]